jgi:3-hydroxyisobutyrate dehydrogenase-like beta-hydroxyacid dehydrogenase
MEANDATQQDRRGFLKAAGVAATTVALAGLPSAARGVSEAIGKMKIENVGVMSPGDMGQAVAIQIKAKGLHVYTALEHRRERTRGLAREAGLTDVGTLARLVVECDVVLSIMDPGAAVDFAREVSDAIRASGRTTLIVDCNAIAPQTVHEIAALVEQAGGRFLDAGIIGSPPRGTAKANLYVSGPGASDLEQLAGPQLLVHPIGERVADASALKM